MWRPQDYIGYSERVGIKQNDIPLGRVVEEIRAMQDSGLSEEELAKQQELLPSSGQTAEEMEASKRKLMEILRGY